MGTAPPGAVRAGSRQRATPVVPTKEIKMDVEEETKSCHPDKVPIPHPVSWPSHGGLAAMGGDAVTDPRRGGQATADSRRPPRLLARLGAASFPGSRGLAPGCWLVTYRSGERLRNDMQSSEEGETARRCDLSYVM